MTSKERVLAALNFEEPDRVPLDCWLSPEITDTLKAHFGLTDASDPFALLKRLGHDVLYRRVGFCEGFGTVDDESKKIAENLYQDEWGIKWRYQAQEFGGYCEMVEHPFADIRKYDVFQWPDPLIISAASLNENRDMIERNGGEFAIAGFVACSVWEGAWYLRGLENLLVDLNENLDFVEDLLEHTMRHSLILSKELVKMGIDILFWGDDFSIETGPLMRPDLFRGLLKPRYARAFEECRKIDPGLKVAFHCDGNLEWALDDLVEIGVNIVNPLQPDVNDTARVKKRYDKRLAVWGNVDTRRVMSDGSVSDVVEEVKRVFRTLSPGGGHIFCSNHRVQTTARALDNVIAYYWAAEHFRDYPIL
jgi:uroporphyrinogen decarboxylase